MIKYQWNIGFVLICILLVVVCPIVLYSQNKPNIIVILSDDAGYNDFGVYGGTEVRTPHIDQLAQNGILFTSAYATASVCAPSRAGLLTGRYQQRFGFEHNTSKILAEGVSQREVGLDPDIMTIGNHLQHSGYKTIALGKWHLGEHEHHFPLNRGFDHFYGFIGGHRSYHSIEATEIDPQHIIYDDHHPVVEKSLTYLTDDLTNKALTYIQQYKDEPFFIYLAFNAVHTPMEAKSDTYAQYPNINDDLRRTYLAMLEDMDVSVGRIVEGLKREGLYENTLIIFLNDNGAATNNGADNGALRGLKGSKWEGGIRIPLIIQWPNGLPSHVTSQNLVSAMDVLPTCVSAAGGKIMQGQKIDGKNLLEAYKSKRAAHRDLFWRRGVAKAARSENWKLIAVGDQPLLLFDLHVDPQEQHNLAKEHPDIARKLLRKLLAWEKKMQAPKWFSSYGDYNQLMKHRMEVTGREMERMYP